MGGKTLHNSLSFIHVFDCKEAPELLDKWTIPPKTLSVTPLDSVVSAFVLNNPLILK